MTIQDIIIAYNQKRIPDNIIYSYTFSLSKYKILAVYTGKGFNDVDVHSLFLLNLQTNMTEIADGSMGWFFFTPKDAMESRKNNILTYHIPRFQDELGRIDKELKQL